jgi:hypothetical protein
MFGNLDLVEAEIKMLWFKGRNLKGWVKAPYSKLLTNWYASLVFDQSKRKLKWNEMLTEMR